MCRRSNPTTILHNLYYKAHSLFQFNHSLSLVSPEDLHTQVQSLSTCTVHNIYDIETVQLHYKYSLQYKKQKLADIQISPYMDEHSYLDIINYLESYFDGKTFSVVNLDADNIYLYYDGECVNTIMNNIVTYYEINH